MAEVAPQFALPPRGEWVTAQQQAGVTTPENLYGSDDMPLPYIQDQGGERQFFSPGGASAAHTGTQQGAQGMAGLAPMPIQGAGGERRNVSIAPMPLRGVGMPNIGPQNDRVVNGGNLVPMPMGEQPNDLLLGAPVEDYIDGNGQPASQRRPMPNLPGIVRHGPPMNDRQLEDQRQNRIRNSDPRYSNTANISNSPIRQPAPNQNLEYSRQMMDVGGQNTLFDMLEQGQFPIPEFLRTLAGPRQAAPGSTVGTSVGAQRPVSDARPQSTNVQRTNQQAPGGFQRPANAGQWEGRAPEIESWIRAGNIRLTDHAGYRRGNARPGGHPAGNSIDVPPDQLDAFWARMRQHPEFRNIPRQQRFVAAGTDFGNGVVATGDHYHIDFGPAAQR